MSDWADISSHLSVSVDLDRTQLYELGRKGPYHRYVTFPIGLTDPGEHCNRHGVFFLKKGCCLVCIREALWELLLNQKPGHSLGTE